MTRPTRSRRAAIAAVALTAVAVLTGCTAQPATAPEPVATAAPASQQRFACPTAAEVAALTATPFGSRTTTSRSCTYTTGADVDPAVSVAVQRLDADDHRTAAVLRYAALTGGDATADAAALGFDAFTASTRTSCTAWFPGPGGVLTSVTARRDGTAGGKSCDLATAIATLTGGDSASSSTAPTVAVLAQRRLLGTATAGARWPFRIGRDAGARIDRLTGTGYLRPASSTSLAAAARRVPRDSAAVVLVSGTAEAGASRLQVLTAATEALSAAAARAPKAKLVVVGPVANGTIPPAELNALRVDLQSAAEIAGAVYLDPAAEVANASRPAVALDAVADAVTAQLREAGVGAS
jgi:hypothetical protein